MSKNKKIVWGIVEIIILVIVFFVGASYGKGQTSTSTSSAATAYGGARTKGAGGFGGGTVGQIISKDATSITVALTSGGSKIIFLDNTTPITKQVSGTTTDLSVGTNVAVTGTANTDGSVSAQSIQIRPNMGATTTTPSVVQ
jgi:hypothetical protein